MSLIDENGRLMGKVNLIDAIVTGVIALTAIGVLMVQSGWHTTSADVVKKESDIEYTFLLKHVRTTNPQLLKKDDTLSMTIRNQPRGDLKITDVEVTPKRVMLSSSGKPILTEDWSDPSYDFVVKVRDHALVTTDGYVTNGVKVKIGMTIDVEGFDYRIPGVIMDVKAIDAETN